jgi:phosphate:Na+ symporter
MLGGIVLFLFGMALLGEHLRELSGGRAERALRRVTDSRWHGALLGFAVTAVVQSSSAVTVLAVSLADAGILSLHQVVPVLIGSNVGTTATAWLLCLRAGTLAAASALTVMTACMGFLLYLLLPKRRIWGELLLALFLLLTGMERMTDAAAPLTKTDAFSYLTALALHPLSAVLVGAAVTGVLQSSSAAIGLLQAFAATGMVPWSVGVPLVLGGNIGTCVTVLLASISGGPNAKRAALAHLRFNLLGTAALLPLWLSFGVSLRNCPMGSEEVAAVHTAFNLLSAVLLLPLSDYLTGVSPLPVRTKQMWTGGREK